MDCNICYETYDMESIVWLDCLHNLCKNCYDRLTQPLCPYCRFNIPKNNNILPEQPILSASAPTPIIQIPRDWEQNTRIERRRRQREREIERYSRRRRRIQIQNNTQEITEEIPIQHIQHIQHIQTEDNHDEYIFNLEESINDNNLQKYKNIKNNRWNHLNNQRSRYTNR